MVNSLTLQHTIEHAAENKMQIIKSKLKLNPPIPFDFKLTATSHGWVALAPNAWDRGNELLYRVEQLSDGTVVSLDIYKSDGVSKPEIIIEVSHLENLSPEQKSEISGLVGHMLRLDEDFSGLYSLAAKNGENFDGMSRGFGRLLRSPTVFEDVVKTICTTNIQWGGTKRMVRELVNGFGTSFKGATEKKTFPSDRDIACYSLDEFRTMTNLGYRTDYIYELALRVSTGQITLQSFLDPKLTTTELKKKLLEIKGIGNYAAATMLMLLGHYDQLPVDSVFRDFVFKKYFKGKVVPEKRAEKIYSKWGRWKYLAYWYDMENGN